MLEDTQGLPVTTDSSAAIADINQFIHQSLCYGNSAEIAVLEGITADPDCALLHAYAAAYYLSQENAASRRLAMGHVQKMQQSPDRLTPREQAYIRAIATWAEGAIDRAIALHEAIADAFPQDLISVQQGQYHYFYQGDANRLLRLAERVLPANLENHFLYGMVAFGYEQCGDLAKAEACGQRALAINRQDPWAQHAIAHVLETQGRALEGIEWMRQYADTWETCNSMLYTHNWWHVALFYLRRGDSSTVLNLYDRHIWGRARREMPKDQVGAIATLLRLELQGVDVGRRWHDLSDYLRPRLHEHTLPFQDLHFIYALERAERSDLAAEMLTSMRNFAQIGSLARQQLWATVVLPVAEAMVAHAQEDWMTAIARLQLVLPHLSAVGGSRTQRQLFQKIYQHALKQNPSRVHPVSGATVARRADGFQRSEARPNLMRAS